MSLNVNNVSHFEVSQACREGYPCRHKCAITLTDGRKIVTDLNGSIIKTLLEKIQASGSNRVTCRHELTHFHYPHIVTYPVRDILRDMFSENKF